MFLNGRVQWLKAHLKKKSFFSLLPIVYNCRNDNYIYIYLLNIDRAMGMGNGKINDKSGFVFL